MIVKKLLTVAVLICGAFACTQDDAHDVNLDDQGQNLSPLENMVEDLYDNQEASSNARTSNAVGTAENPIVVGLDAFVDHVSYTRELCSTGVLVTLPRRTGIFFGSPNAGVSPAPNRYTLSGDCFALNRNAATVEEYDLTKYYEIFGEVVRLSDPGNSNGFWFRDIPNSSQVQRVNFFEDGSKQIGEPIDFPYEVGLNCAGIAALPSSIIASRFQNGDLRVRDGKYLYRFNNLRFSFVGVCGTTSGGGSTDICEGVATWDSGRRYTAGDQVIFRDYLFTKLRFGWRREGKCD